MTPCWESMVPGGLNFWGIYCWTPQQQCKYNYYLTLFWNLLNYRIQVCIRILFIKYWKIIFNNWDYLNHMKNYLPLNIQVSLQLSWIINFSKKWTTRFHKPLCNYNICLNSWKFAVINTIRDVCNQGTSNFQQIFKYVSSAHLLEQSRTLGQEGTS